MAKKKVTLDDLKDRRADAESCILRIRAVMEGHKIELAKIHSPENKRMLSAEGLRDKEVKLRAKTHASIAKWREQFVKDVGDSYDHQSAFTREHAFRHARFVPPAEGIPYSTESKMNAVLHELLEDTRRSNAESRAQRFSAEDLAIETELAATQGNVALVAVFANEARHRGLSGLEKLAVDMAVKKLETPEIDEAQSVYKELDGLIEEGDALTTLWNNPNDEIALAYESLGRFDRRKREEQKVKDAEAEGQQKAEEKAKAEASQQAIADKLTQPQLEEKLVHDTIAEGEEKAKMEARAKQHAAFPMPTDDPIEPQQSSAA